MENILTKLISSEFLSEDVKVQITEEFGKAIDELKVQLREEVEADVKTQLVQEWQTQRNALVEALDETIQETLETELSELKDSLAEYKDLEVEYAAKLVEEKKQIAETVGKEIDNLVDKLDQFLDLRIKEEFDELHEQISEARQNIFGRKIFEAYSREFAKSFVDENDTQSKLVKAERELDEVKTKLEESVKANDKIIREKTFDSILAPLSGSKREQMSILLQNVPTEKLQESYNVYIAKIIKEEKKVEKEEVIVENKEVIDSKVITGNEVIRENKEVIVEDAIDERFLKIAGLKR